MTLERLAVWAETAGIEASARARDRLIVDAHLPAGVDATPLPQGILLSGKGLRRRFVTEPELRNFAT